MENDIPYAEMLLLEMPLQYIYIYDSMLVSEFKISVFK